MNYYLPGIAFLALAKAKHVLRGYSTPKPFAVEETDRCIDYDIHIVNRWLERLTVPLAGKHVLELGPGSDLGIGLYLLSLGAAKYSACDVHDLESRTPQSFYERLFQRIDAPPSLREQLARFKRGEPDRLQYVVQDDFDLPAAVGAGTVDIVLSNAAFEHFDDIDSTVEQLTSVCKPGAVIVAEVDLMTHSRWIREKDPLNIYRYPDWLYKAFHFRGQPNRVRPREYCEAFERHGWLDVEILPLRKAASVPGRLQERFADDESDYLVIAIRATRGLDAPQAPRH